MVLLTNTSPSNNVDNCSMSSGAQTCDSNTGEANLHVHQHDIGEVFDILKVPKLLTNDDKSGNRSEGMQNDANVTVHLTAMQQAVVLAYCLLIEKSSRHDEMQSKLPYFAHACMILCLVCALLHIGFLLNMHLFLQIATCPLRGEHLLGLCLEFMSSTFLSVKSRKTVVEECF